MLCPGWHTVPGTRHTRYSRAIWALAAYALAMVSLAEAAYVELRASVHQTAQSTYDEIDNTPTAHSAVLAEAAVRTLSTCQQCARSTVCKYR